MKSIGIDTGKKRCDACIVDGRDKVLQKNSYENTKGAGRFARQMARKYGSAARPARPA